MPADDSNDPTPPSRPLSRRERRALARGKKASSGAPSNRPPQRQRDPTASGRRGRNGFNGSSRHRGDKPNVKKS